MPRRPMRSSALISRGSIAASLSALAHFASLHDPALALTDISPPSRHPNCRRPSAGHVSDYSLARVRLHQKRPSRPLDSISAEDDGGDDSGVFSVFRSDDDYNDSGGYDYDSLFRSPAERSRPLRRTVFDHNRWLKHRSTDRFFRRLGSIPRSFIIRDLLDEVAVVAAVCVLVIFWNEALFDGWTDLAGVRHEPLHVARGAEVLPRLILPALPFSLSSPALGLLLVFRTNASYARWNEGRKSWQKIATRCRSLVVTAATWVGSGDVDSVGDKSKTESSEYSHRRRTDEVEAIRRLGAAAWALPRALRKRVSGDWDPDEEYESDIRSNLDAEPADRTLSAQNPVLRTQYDLLRAVKDLPGLSADKRFKMVDSVNEIGDLCGTCEGLYTSPVPLSYTRHTARVMTMWMLLLPAALYEPFGTSWNHAAMIPAAAVLSFLFFGVEEIAVSLEEPFSILPLDRLTEDVRLAAIETLDWFVAERGY